MNYILRTGFAVLAGVLCLHSLTPKETKAAWKLIEDFTNDYGIPFQWGPEVVIRVSNVITHDPIESDNTYYLLQSAPFVIGEFRKYPPAFIRNSGLERFILLKNFSQKRGGQLVKLNGMASPSDKAILLDTFQMHWNDEDSSRTLHHEFFHILDIDDNRREMLPYWSNLSPEDKKRFRYATFESNRAEMLAWSALNPKDFVYRGLESIADKYRIHAVDHPFPGFASLYGTANLLEDRAELFGLLRSQIRYEQICDLAREDSFLSNKIERLKIYLQARHPEMDERFWRGYTNDAPEP